MRTARAGRTGDLRVELIAQPRSLSPERDELLNIEVADLAARACGGPEACAEPEVREGWRKYCTLPGGRTCDHDRVVLVWDGDRLVGFNGLVVERMDPDVTLLWYRAAGTDPAYQAKGGFSRAFDAMLEPSWMMSFGRPTYWLYRTPNPVIYETVRRLWSKHSEWSERLFPKIAADGDLMPIDAGTRDIATRITAKLWPDCEFDAQSFVVRDFLGTYGQDIWRVPVATSSDAGVNRFFAHHLRPDNRDALLVIYLFNA